MPITCPYCDQHFEKSNTINSRHKAICPGWQEQGVSEPPRVCLCGHVSTSLTQMKRHRQQCDTWKSRVRSVVQMQRLAETLQSHYGEGVHHLTDIPEVKERRKATNKERYGAENVFCKGSSVFDKVQQSLEGKRPVLKGSDNPFSRPEVQAKIRETVLTVYGVSHVQQSRDIKAKKRRTAFLRYGVDEVLASPLIRKRIHATNIQKYGGRSPANSPEIRAKMRNTCRIRYGNPWGAHCSNGPNKLEAQFHTLFPMFLFTGSGSLWRWLPLLQRNKNPDFILPGPDPSNPKKSVTKVVEIFGDYWHSEKFTGLSPLAHEERMLQAWKEIGVRCLVIWEHELKVNALLVQEKVKAFLTEMV